jgi:hypothetical protein
LKEIWGIGMCEAQKNKYVQMMNQTIQDDLEEFPSSPNNSSNHLQSMRNSLHLRLNPNHNLIKIKNWNTDMKFEEEQLYFLKIFQKKFADLDVWYPNVHEVRL